MFSDLEVIDDNKLQKIEDVIILNSSVSQALFTIYKKKIQTLKNIAVKIIKFELSGFILQK